MVVAICSATSSLMYWIERCVSFESSDGRGAKVEVGVNDVTFAVELFKFNSPHQSSASHWKSGNQ